MTTQEQASPDLNATLKAIESKLNTLEIQRTQLQQQIEVKRNQIDSLKQTIFSLEALGQIPSSAAAPAEPAPAAAPAEEPAAEEAPKRRGRAKKS
jgi:predicted  nucleic acid-binding Zn-ribbon protein